jgi:mono/diheme cytochrome c family protein
MARFARWAASEQAGDDVSDRRRRIELAVLVAGLVAVAAGLLLSAPQANARPKFMSEFAEAFPAAAGSQLDSCALCHTDPARPREENLNNFGLDWEDGDLGDKDFLAPALLNRDSDGDGVANGAEIQQLSLPGDPLSSSPPTTTTTVPGTPPDGQALYGARCASCHGSDGGNLSGTGLARSAFISITLNGQGGMPAQSDLTNEQAGAIWDYVTGTVPATTTTTTTLPGATTTTTTPLTGSVVWAQNCAACHGANGGNVVPTSLSRSQLVAIVTNGTGSMRGFPELGSTQIGNVADYLLSRSAPTTTLPGATTTTTTPRSGTAVFAASCALCHGTEAANLRGHDLSLSQIISITADGKGAMRGFAGTLSDAEIGNVSQYVSSFGAVPGVTTTVPAGTSLSGSTLYMQNCSGCHGLHGEGGVGGALAGIAMSRSGIISLIDAGTSGMPAYGSQLTGEEMGAIADHILGVIPAGGSGGSAGDSIPGDGATDSPLLSAELREGHSLYDRLCASCHGARGEGGFGGPLTGIEVSAAGLREVIRQGLGTMPAFAGQMSDSELDALVAFTQALASDPTLGDSTIDQSDDQPDDDRAGLARGGVGNPIGEEGVPVIVIMFVIVGVLGAGGAAYLWIRSARSLVE